MGGHSGPHPGGTAVVLSHDSTCWCNDFHHALTGVLGVALVAPPILTPSDLRGKTPPPVASLTFGTAPGATHSVHR